MVIYVFPLLGPEGGEILVMVARESVGAAGAAARSTAIPTSAAAPTSKAAMAILFDQVFCMCSFSGPTGLEGCLLRASIMQSNRERDQIVSE